MNCDELKRLMTAHLDEELAVSEEIAFQAHLSTCDTCRRRTEFESNFDRTLGERLAPGPVPEEVERRLRRRLARESVRSRPAWSRWLLHPATGYAVAAVLLVALLLPVAAPRLAPWHSELGTLVELSGRLICMECERHHRTADEQRGCREFNHRTGIQTPDGEAWSLAAVGAGAELRAHPELRGSLVLVRGKLYPDLRAIAVEDFDLL